MRRRKQAGKIHFVFGVHGERDPFLLKPVKTPDVFLTEWRTPSTRGPIPPELYRWMGFDKSRFDRQEARFAMLLKESGGRIFSGEHHPSKATFNVLGRLERKSESAFFQFRSHLSFPTFRVWADADMEYALFRERLMAQSPAFFSKQGKNVLARYGGAHSLISKKLADKGVPSTRDIRSNVFYSSLLLHRKKILGLPVSEKDYRLAYVSLHLENYMLRMRFSTRESLFLENELLKQFDRRLELTRFVEEIDQIPDFEPRKEFVARHVFEQNGLPANPSRKELLDWLRAHSAFWRMVKRGPARRREMKRKEKP